MTIPNGKYHKTMTGGYGYSLRTKPLIIMIKMQMNSSSFSISRTNCESAPPKIKKIYFDKQNNLWIAKQPKGLVKVSFKKIFFSLSVPDIAEYPSSNELRSIMEDADHNIWVGSKNGDIQVYDSNKAFHRLPKLHRQVIPASGEFRCRICLATRSEGKYMDRDTQ